MPDLNISTAMLMQLENDVRRCMAMNGLGRMLGMPTGFQVVPDPKGQHWVTFRCDPNSADTAELRRLIEEERAKVPPGA